ncbi:hypothetical protein BY458DRAFT_519715 [Sporodiniella umbellata]|nr:hypothetical protein BY458DRAFT_519715 [Sporodiniella umbellata]
MLKRQGKTWMACGVAATLLFGLGSTLAYYLVERDRKVRRCRVGERTRNRLLLILKQARHEQQVILDGLASLDKHQDLEAHYEQVTGWCECLEKWMSQVQDMRPLTQLVGTTDGEPTEQERVWAHQLREQKLSVISQLETTQARVERYEQELKTRVEQAKSIEIESIEVDDEEVRRRAVEELEIDGQTTEEVQMETTLIELEED